MLETLTKEENISSLINKMTRPYGFSEKIKTVYGASGLTPDLALLFLLSKDNDTYLEGLINNIKHDLSEYISATNGLIAKKFLSRLEGILSQNEAELVSGTPADEYEAKMWDRMLEDFKEGKPIKIERLNQLLGIRVAIQYTINCRRLSILIYETMDKLTTSGGTFIDNRLFTNELLDPLYRVLNQYLFDNTYPEFYSALNDPKNLSYKLNIIDSKTRFYYFINQLSNSYSLTSFGEQICLKQGIDFPTYTVKRSYCSSRSATKKDKDFAELIDGILANRNKAKTNKP